MSKLTRILVGVLFVFALTQAATAATFTVTKTADTNDGVCDADCSLREAITAANTTADNDVIEFGSPLFNSFQIIVLSLGEIVIANNGSLTINGPGADKLTIDGNMTSRIIRTGAGVVASIRGITFTRGNGVSPQNNNSGGAILNDIGNLTIAESVFVDNTTSSSAGAVRNSGLNSVMSIANCLFMNNTSTTSSAGAVQNFSTSTMTIVGSTFMGNRSGGGTAGGGAIQGNGTLTITNTTFSGNISQATGGGGAIYSNGALLLMTNVTMTGNIAGNNGGGLHRATTNDHGYIRNSIIAGNNGAAASPDVTNLVGGIDSQGNNLIGMVGTSTGWAASDILNMPALISPLGNYGGPTMTHALLSGSPALDAGQNCVLDLSCPANNPPAVVTTDQRGATRPFDSTVDIGAFEASSSYRAVLSNALLNQVYDAFIVPRLGDFAYNVSSGSLPPGLQLQIVIPSQSDLGGSGLLFITGIPTQAGTFDFSLTATNGTNSTVINYRIIVVGSAAPATIIGRVLTADGRPIRGANVFISTPLLSGVPTFITPAGYTSSLGYFTLEDVVTGQSYQISATAKGHSVSPQTVVVTGDIFDLVLTASPNAALNKEK